MGDVVTSVLMCFENFVAISQSSKKMCWYVWIRLKTLVLSGNQLERLLPYQFPSLEEIKKIDLSNTGDGWTTIIFNSLGIL